MASISLSLLALAAGVNAQPPWFDGDSDSSGYGGFGSGYGFGNNGNGRGNTDGSGSNGNGNGNDGFGVGAFQNGAGFDVQTAMNYRHIHGTLAAVAFVGFFPLGSILMRVIPGRFAWIIHAITQILGYIVYIAGAALGIYLVQMVRIPPNNTTLLQMEQTRTHPIIGLVVLGAIFFQPILGWIHHVKFKTLGRRTMWSHAHLWIGRLAITLGIINGGLGLSLSGAQDSAVTAYAVVAAIIWCIWVLAAVLGEVKRSRAAREVALTEQPSPPYTPGPVYGGGAFHSAPRERERGGSEIELTAKKSQRRRDSVSS